MKAQEHIPPSACPVDHDTRSRWASETSASTSSSMSHKSSMQATSQPRRFSSVEDLVARTNNNAPAAAAALAYLSLNDAPSHLFREQPSRSSRSRQTGPAQTLDNRGLSTEREVSSIPRYLPEGEAVPPSACPSAEKDRTGNWVYPSPAQFYAAMARKNHNPDGKDMPVVVPIHNAVNERAWADILDWDKGWGTEESSRACGGLKLVSFQGKPKERTWKAWGRVMMGYRPPFDRHDWIVDRCGERQRFIIDFYSGRSTPFSSSTSSPTETGKLPAPAAFYLDVRPAPDATGILMRLHRALGLGGWKDVSSKKPAT